jgi:hypothetical protein
VSPERNTRLHEFFAPGIAFMRKAKNVRQKNCDPLFPVCLSGDFFK